MEAAFDFCCSKDQGISTSVLCVFHWSNSHGPAFANRRLNIHLLIVSKESFFKFFLGLEKIRGIRESLTDDGGNGGRGE